MQCRLCVMIPAVLAGLSGWCGASAEPSVYPTGVTVYDPARAYNGDVLFTGADNHTYLIDMNGRVLKRWEQAGFPPKIVDPALMNGEKGVIGLQLSAGLVPAGSGKGGTGVVPGAPAAFRNLTVGLLDWNDKVLWQWGTQAPGGAALQHHDWAKLANGDVLVLSNVRHAIAGLGGGERLDDVIYEVDPRGRPNGGIVWSWLASDHLSEYGFTPAELELVRQSPDADYLHTNDMAVLGPNRWADSGDKRFAPDNIMISSRNANVTLIIDKASGHVVWRLGPDYPPRVEGKAETTPRPVDQIVGQHDAHMIAPGLPGAGNILMFDNQGEAGYPPAPLGTLGGSRALEIDPVAMRIVWQYAGANSGQPSWMFYSPFLGTAQRLANGNTLIDEGSNGRLFQVEPAGSIVWEYVAPMFGDVPAPPQPGHQQPISLNALYRCQFVPYDWVPAASGPGTPVHLPVPAAFHPASGAAPG